ncbi:zinc finger family protein / programmed cell death 2 C-terminal domain-containing protein [Perilla frutescens var. hirtella]|uniref:Zinc finger family protein / programmed cell death 2 C-terminal domain-containing protein n=1 Tax=Perilla frutescens var. hirtella TaxID=608512 RepID=A0AAD4IPX1_PERFH|nr:zinc finger family protein / programmed cell death 2 C-terminal domain-containing protein [Perilla frutescens var. hirtella]
MDTDFAEEKLKSLQISSLSEEEEEEEDDEGRARHDDVDDVVSDEVSDEEERIPMTLGFAEKPKNSWSLRRQYFPCKAGGSPAWLDPINLPSGRSSLCDFCCEPLQFLLQVYAPLPEESTFHRTLFVFICTSMSCLLRDQHEQWKQPPQIQSRSVKVFRCQLPRANPFYSSEAPVRDENQQPLTAGAMLCDWCGTWKGDKICSSCKRARYCSGKHQAAHWRSSSSSHKVLCRQFETSGKESESAASNSLWPEYEITNEDESEFDEPMSDDNGPANSLVSRSRTEGSYGKLINYFQGSRENRSWASFQERISSAPDQVLRYSSSSQAKPIWPVSSGRPSRPDIPVCNHCGSTRAFEFQVLPQLLYFFHVKDDGEDSLDWATIAVYTCEGSCEGGASYKEEFAWVQLASQSISQSHQ